MFSRVETEFLYGIRQKLLDARSNMFCIDSQATFAPPCVLFTLIFSLKCCKAPARITVIRRNTECDTPLPLGWYGFILRLQVQGSFFI